MIQLSYSEEIAAAYEAGSWPITGKTLDSWQPLISSAISSICWMKREPPILMLIRPSRLSSISKQGIKGACQDRRPGGAKEREETTNYFGGEKKLSGYLMRWKGSSTKLF